MEVVADPIRGHIALVRGHETVVSFVDLGPVLQVWQHDGGVALTPGEVVELGVALVAWAKRKKAPDIPADPVEAAVEPVLGEWERIGGIRAAEECAAEIRGAIAAVRGVS